jgi:hypothetical protein
MALETPLPEPIRLQLEAELQVKLSRKFTFGDAIALKLAYCTLGYGRTVRLDVAQEIRRAAEGIETQRIEIADVPTESDNPKDLKMAVVARMLDMAQKRARMFNMPLPALSEMAAEAGVTLDIPTEPSEVQDDKPK